MKTVTLSTQTRRLRFSAAALIAGVLVGMIAGCGGSAEAERPTGKIPADVEKAYNKCMTKAGYPQVEKGTLGEPGKDPLWKDKDFLAAQTKCQEASGLNSFGPDENHGKVDRAKEDKQTLAMTKCLRDRGWDVKDPERTDDGLRLDIPSFDDEEKQRSFNEDFRKCGKKTGVVIDGGPGSDGGHEGGQNDDGHSHGDDGHGD